MNKKVTPQTATNVGPGTYMLTGVGENGTQIYANGRPAGNIPATDPLQRAKELTRTSGPGYKNTTTYKK